MIHEAYMPCVPNRCIEPIHHKDMCESAIAQTRVYLLSLAQRGLAGVRGRAGPV